MLELARDDVLPAALGFEPTPGSGSSIEGHWNVDSIDDLCMSLVYPTDVVEELNGTEVRIPGFVVPLELADSGKVRELTSEHS